MTRRSTDVARYGQAGPAVVALRLSGAEFTKIAETVGLASPAEAMRLFLDTLAATVTDADRDLMRAEADAQLRALLHSVWFKATDPGDPEQLPALREARALVDRHIKLHGLDAPSEVVVHTPTTTELEAWVRTVVGEATAVEVDEADIVDAEITDEGAA